MEERKRQVGFYTLMMVLNIAVVIMFRTVTTAAPIARAYEISTPIVHRPIAAISGTPNRLVVESAGIDLPVDLGTFDQNSGAWTLSDDRAYYADSSVPANNNNGTTLIYGHAITGIFGSLPEMQVGAKAAVYTNNGHVFNYQYQSVKQFDPNDVSIFTSSGPPLLTLQTCAGAWDMYRSMYMFQFVGEEKV
jgi:LPXTG-site transpeptidase (sortase) family protein